LIDLLGAVGGLALGIALTVVMELVDRSLKTATEVGLVLNMPVIGLIPMVITRRDRRRARWRHLGFSLGLAAMFAACITVAWLTFRI
jgi:glucose-6-phosphate-specific signal transduction histidine kinase